MRSGMHELGSVIAALTEALDLGPGLRAQRAVAEFASIVGPAISAHAWAEDMRGDVLLVVTDSPVWAHQLQMLEPELISKLRAALGEGCPVARLRFRSGSRRRAFQAEPAAGDAAGGGQTAQRRPRRRLSRREWHDVRTAANQAEDTALAKALIGVLRAQIGAERDAASGDGKPPGSSEVEGDSAPVL